MSQTAALPLVSPDFADFASRLKATTADILFYLIAIWTLPPLLHKVSELFHVPTVGGFLIIALVVLFEALQVSIWGRTLGHALFGLRVVNVRGEKPNFFQALARWFIKLVLGLFTFLSMMGGSGQAVHDILTRTRVLYAR